MKLKPPRLASAVIAGTLGGCLTAGPWFGPFRRDMIPKWHAAWAPREVDRRSGSRLPSRPTH